MDRPYFRSDDELLIARMPPKDGIHDKMSIKSGKLDAFLTKVFLKSYYYAVLLLM